MDCLEDLEAWEKSCDLYIGILDITKILPEEEKYSPKNQIIRSFRAAAAKITEGYEKFYSYDTSRFSKQ